MSIEMLVNVNLQVDKLHSVRKEIKRLQDEEADLKKELGEMKVDEIEGYHCKLVITHVAKSYSTDYKAACTFAQIPKEVLDRFQKTKEAYDVYNIRPL